MNLTNLPNLAKMLTFYTKHPKLAQYRHLQHSRIKYNFKLYILIHLGEKLNYERIWQENLPNLPAHFEFGKNSIMKTILSVRMNVIIKFNKIIIFMD